MRQLASRWLHCEVVKAKSRGRDPRISKLVSMLSENVARITLRLQHGGKSLRTFAVCGQRHRHDAVGIGHQRLIPPHALEGQVALPLRPADCGFGFKLRQGQLGARPFALRLRLQDSTSVSVEQWQWKRHPERRKNSCL